MGMWGMVKISLLVLMVIALTACPPFCNPEILDFGKLPEEALAFVPYEDGASYRFVHSAGQEIVFTASRESTEETENRDECRELRYEKNTCHLYPDYPIFSISLLIIKDDTAHWSVNAVVGSSNFLLPVNNETRVDHLFLDSLEIDGAWYKNVYRIRSWDSFYNSGNGIRPDSLWYNSS